MTYNLQNNNSTIACRLFKYRNLKPVMIFHIKLKWIGSERTWIKKVQRKQPALQLSLDLNDLGFRFFPPEKYCTKSCLTSHLFNQRLRRKLGLKWPIERILMTVLQRILRKILIKSSLMKITFCSSFQTENTNFFLSLNVYSSVLILDALITFL